MKYERPLSTTELHEIAHYLYGTKAHIQVALSELGFDPDDYPDIRRWLSREVGLRQSNTNHLWYLKD